MAGLMNNYFYGKAGKGDYTVEQMPTTRKQLFFTTLRVRLSSMAGLNFLHLLFCLPALIWLFMSYQVITVMVSPDAWQAGSPSMKQAYEEYMGNWNRLQEIDGAEEKIKDCEKLLSGIEDKLQLIREGKEVIVEVAPVVEGGEVTKRPATLEEVQLEKQETVSEIARLKNLISATTDEERQALASATIETRRTYETYRTNELQSNLSMMFLLLIPLLGIAGIGSTGQMYVLRNWARDEHAFMWQDYKQNIKSNWKQGLVVGLLNGLSFYLCFIAFIFYGNMAQTTNAFFAVPQWFMVMLLIVWWMMNEVIFPMMVTYDMKIKQLIRNSFIMVMARLPISFAILLGSIILPVILLLFVPPQIGLLVLILLYGIIGFSLTGFVYASYANSCFDKYLNPRIEGAEVNKGLRQADDDDDDDEELPPVEQKEDRFWEHKS